MNETKADSVAAPAAGRASSYFPRFAADPKYGLDPMREIDYSCYAGSSAFVSTASDLVRFAMAMNGNLRQGSGGQVGKLLQPATVQLLQTSQRLPSGEETGYGLGWDLETVDFGGAQTTTVGHDGDSLGGMVASFVTFANSGIVVAVLSNSSYADTAGVAMKVAQAFAR
jgi:CubicO group peptidase (beta-lactamase class C family)